MLTCSRCFCADFVYSCIEAGDSGSMGMYWSGAEQRAKPACITQLAYCNNVQCTFSNPPLQELEHHAESDRPCRLLARLRHGSLGLHISASWFLSPFIKHVLCICCQTCTKSGSVATGLTLAEHKTTCCTM